MQKLEFGLIVESLVDKMDSFRHVENLNRDTVSRQSFIRSLVDTKTIYDQALLNHNESIVLQYLSAGSVFDNNNFSLLLTAVSQIRPDVVMNDEILNTNTLKSNLRILDFYAFQQSLLQLRNVFTHLLLPSEIKMEKGIINYESNLEEGNLFFVIVDDGFPSISKLTKVFNALNNLIESIYLLLEKIEGNLLQKPSKIILLDSGTDVNIVVKVLKSVADIITKLGNDFWDFLIHRKNHNHDRNMASMDQTLDVLIKLKDARDKGAIDDITEGRLKTGIINSTQALFDNNTLPRNIAEIGRVHTNRTVLLEKNNSHLLGSGSEDVENLPTV